MEIRIPGHVVEEAIIEYIGNHPLGSWSEISLAIDSDELRACWFKISVDGLDMGRLNNAVVRIEHNEGY